MEIIKRGVLQRSKLISSTQQSYRIPTRHQSQARSHAGKQRGRAKASVCTYQPPQRESSWAPGSRRGTHRRRKPQTGLTGRRLRLHTGWDRKRRLRNKEADRDFPLSQHWNAPLHMPHSPSFGEVAVQVTSADGACKTHLNPCAFKRHGR